MASDALDRLATLYNGGAYDATTNPGGMDDGGHTVNFVPALQDVAAVGVEVAANATNLQAAVAAAAASASDANADAVTSMAAAAASTTKAEQAEDAAATASNANLSATARAQECEDTKTIIDGLLASVEQYAGTASNAALTATAKANTCTEISDSLAGLLTSVELYTTTASNAALTATGKADECDSIASSLTTLQTTVEGYASNAALSASAALEAAQNAADVVPASSEETAGKIKLATNLMMTEGTDDTTAVTPVKGAAAYVRRSEMGVPNGVATLDADGLGDAWISTATASNAGKVLLTADTGTAFAAGADLDLGGHAVATPKLTGWREGVQALGTLSTDTTIDCAAGNVVTATIGASLTLSFSNVPASGTGGAVELWLTNAGAYTVAWPTGVVWPDATAPTLTAAGVDIVVLKTIDGGTSWRGAAVTGYTA